MGCTFCNALKEGREISWDTRSKLAKDNLCEKVFNTECTGCTGCEYDSFSLSSFTINDNIHVCVNYYRDVKGIIVAPFSYGIQFSFCPFCGEKISKDIRTFEDVYSLSLKEE